MKASAPLLAIATLAIAAGVGCKKGDEERPAPEPEGPPPVTAAEEERGEKACADYREKVCACAETNPSLASDCGMADSRREALELSLRISRAAGESDDGRAAALGNARRVMQRCIEQAAELARGCPEPPAAESD